MKLQALELPLGKPQTRRSSRTPKIAPLLVALILLFTVIPLYYPYFKSYYITETNSSDKVSETTTLFQGEPTPTVFSNVDPVLDSVIEQNPGPNDEPEPGSSATGLAEEENNNDHDQRKEEEPEPEVTKLPTKRDPVRPRRKPVRRGGRKRANRRSRKRPKKMDLDYLNTVEKEEGCDLFSGEWVQNPDGPYYTNRTCWAIQEHQNCMKFGRPDADFLKWQWKPDGCELPIFEPAEFLELVRGKSIAFVGDSVARNHMQSLICLLSRVAYPFDVSKKIDQNARWVYPDYNFNISMFWAPYLVRTEKTVENDATKPFKLYLDEFDTDWTRNVGSYDYIVISAGHWFFRPTMFYTENRLIGCQYCPDENVTRLNSYFSYRRAFRTAFKAINSLDNFKGVTFVRTFAPSHFEGGKWDKGGDCTRTKPFRRGEKDLDDYNLEMYSIQLQELRVAQKEAKKTGQKFKLFDVTKSMLLRPDGHPSKYGHWPDEDEDSRAKDCVHWCLPGPIDSWNDFLLELFKREESVVVDS